MAIVETEHRAHEKAPAEIVVELRHLPDVATVVRQVSGDGRDDAGHRGTGDLDDEMVFFVLHDTSSGRWRQLIAKRKNIDNSNLVHEGVFLWGIKYS
ncbi:hypothetical protein D3C75_1005120 [compost metagenome]